jgi:hypothetical protein
LKNLIALDEESIGTKRTVSRACRYESLLKLSKIDTTHQRQFNWALANMEGGSLEQSQNAKDGAAARDEVSRPFNDYDKISLASSLTWRG